MLSPFLLPCFQQVSLYLYFIYPHISFNLAFASFNTDIQTYRHMNILSFFHVIVSKYLSDHFCIFNQCVSLLQVSFSYSSVLSFLAITGLQLLLFTQTQTCSLSLSLYLCFITFHCCLIARPFRLFFFSFFLSPSSHNR